MRGAFLIHFHPFYIVERKIPGQNAKMLQFDKASFYYFTTFAQIVVRTERREYRTKSTG